MGQAGKTVRVTPRWNTGSDILEFRTRGGVTWFACTAWNVSLGTHNFAPDARGRPGKRPVGTALSPRLPIRMKSEVQVQPGPLHRV